MVRALIRSILVATLVAAAWAQDKGAGPGSGVQEVAIAADRFTRASPPPAWARMIEVPPTQRRNPVVVRLHDTQFNVDKTPAVFVNRALQVNDAASLAAIGQVQLYFAPDYQRLNLHKISILRDGQALDRTRDVNIRFLQREGRLEHGVYSGAVTVSLLLDDVRIGDTLQVQYSVEGQNPVFGNRFTDVASWDQADPVELRRVSIAFPKERPIRWRMLGDYRKPSVRPETSETIGGKRLLQFEEKGIAGLDFEPFIPSDFLPARLLQFSEFADWGEVSRWAADLFPAKVSLPGELQGVIARINALPTPEERVVAALQWVQSEIRYFSVALGESSHRPYPPDQVLSRRYGDCKDKTFLLVTLLRQLGIEAYPALTSVRSRKGLSKLLPSPEVFDHAIVQVRIGGRKYYVDGTRPRQTGRLDRLGPYAEGADVLVVAPGSTGLDKVEQPNIRELATSELREDFVVKDLGGAGSLSVRQVWHGNSADHARLIVAQLTPEQQRKFAMGSYERRYPGIELIGEPEIRDDPSSNSITLSSKFAVPKLAQAMEDGWVVRFFPANLQGIFNVPDKINRNFPVELPMNPYEARYEQNIEWPQQVSVIKDPSSQRVSSNYFDVVVSRNFRGRNSQVNVSFSSRGDAVPAAEVRQLAEDVTALNRTIGGIVAVGKDSVKSEGLFGIGGSTLQESIRARLSKQLEQIDRVLAAGRLKGEDLAETRCDKAEVLADLGRPQEGIKEAEEAVRLAAGSSRPWHCRGNLHFALGQFAKAISDYTKALSLGHDEFNTFYRRGHARFYLGRLEEAAADFAKAAASAKDGPDGTYATIWQTWTLQRLGRPLPDAVLKAGGESASAQWPGPALAMLTGSVSADQLIARVNKLEGDERELNLTEAWFFVGQHHLANKRLAEARTAFENTRSKGITMYIEHVAAGFELDRLDGKR